MFIPWNKLISKSFHNAKRSISCKHSDTNVTSNNQFRKSWQQTLNKIVKMPVPFELFICVHVTLKFLIRFLFYRNVHTGCILNNHIIEVFISISIVILVLHQLCNHVKMTRSWFWWLVPYRKCVVSSCSCFLINI